MNDFCPVLGHRAMLCACVITDIISYNILQEYKLYFDMLAPGIGNTLFDD
jgi:hypothetical protein